ncbi:MAG: outer membrane beta-barrel protein [Ignavibacteriales bacterium]
MKYFTGVILFLTLLSSIQFAQNRSVAVVLKMGSSSYDLGGFNESSIWRSALQTSAGVEFPISSDFSLQTQLYYSQHEVEDVGIYMNLVQKDPKIRLVDLMCNLKWNIGLFYFIGGMGLSLQNTDEMGVYVKGVYTKLDSKNDKVVRSYLLGFGADVNVWKNLNLIAEANLHIRDEYGGNLLLGAKYYIY